jgi:ATP-binding cassette subfamily G (WHITE) protein 2 (PDR)
MASGAQWPAAQGLAEDVEASLVGKRSHFTSGDEKDEKTLMRETTPGESYTESSEDGGEKVHELARAITQASIKNATGEHINPFDGTDNPLLDPHSGQFSYKVWTKNLLAIQSRDPERYPARVAGISYRNLSAYGFGNATDYQKTFGNYPLELPGLFKRLIGRRVQTKIQILRNFDGLVKAGEMLVVLGRPGS